MFFPSIVRGSFASEGRPQGVLDTFSFLFRLFAGVALRSIVSQRGFVLPFARLACRIYGSVFGYPSVIGPLREERLPIVLFSLSSIKSCLFRVDAWPQTETISTASSDCYHVFSFSRLKSERSPVCVFSIVSYGRAVHDFHGMARGNVRAAFDELHMRMELHTCDWLHVAA